MTMKLFRYNGLMVLPFHSISHVPRRITGGVAGKEDSRIIQVDGYKAFRGIMRIMSLNPKFPQQELHGDWLYKPEHDCWYNTTVATRRVSAKP